MFCWPEFSWTWPGKSNSTLISDINEMNIFIGEGKGGGDRKNMIQELSARICCGSERPQLLVMFCSGKRVKWIYLIISLLQVVWFGVLVSPRILIKFHSPCEPISIISLPLSWFNPLSFSFYTECVILSTLQNVLCLTCSTSASSTDGWWTRQCLIRSKLSVI